MIFSSSYMTFILRLIAACNVWSIVYKLPKWDFWELLPFHAYSTPAKKRQPARIALNKSSYFYFVLYIRWKELSLVLSLLWFVTLVDLTRCRGTKISEFVGRQLSSHWQPSQVSEFSRRSSVSNSQICSPSEMAYHTDRLFICLILFSSGTHTNCTYLASSPSSSLSISITATLSGPVRNTTESERCFNFFETSPFQFF